MFVAPDRVFVDKSGGAFSSNKVNTKTNPSQTIDPSTTLGVGADVLNLLPVERDSFVGGFLNGLNSVLASGVTTTDGRNKLATVDPFKKVVNSPQNQLSSVLSNFFGMPGAIVGGIVENEPLRKMTSELIRTGKVSSETSKAYLKNFGGNVLAGVGGDILNQIQSDIGMTGVDGKQLMSSVLGVDGAPRIEDVLAQNPTVAMVIKGKEYFAQADFNSVDGLFKVIDNLTSPNSISTMLDIKTEMSVFNVITKSLMAFDVPKLFQDVSDHFKKKNNGESGGKAETLYYLDNLDNAIDNSSITYLEETVKRIPAYKILDSNRNFVGDFLKVFTLRYDQEPSADIGIRLDNILTQIDPNWAKAQLIPGQGEYVSSLLPFKQMSNDAERVFTLAGLYQTELVIANYFPIQPMKNYMKALYPYAPI